MKILHILEDFSFNSGGIRTVVKELNAQLNQSGIESFILSSIKEQEDLIFSIDDKKNSWLYSKKWKNQLKTLLVQKKIDILHIHGVWMYPQYIAAKFAIENKIPFVVSPHGMYEPWLWSKGKLKKKCYFNLISKNKFSNASIIHAITNQEKGNLSILFPKVKITEIPNLIYHKENHKDNFTFSGKEKYILYVGRLDEKKGIDLLIKAFKKIDATDIKLKIVGKLNLYHTELIELINSLNINDNSVEFLGFVNGKEKIKLIKNAQVFVAPSYSEVIGMVNLEAGIYKTPVITTYQTGLNPSWNENGGILINPRIDELVNALNEAVKWSVIERIEKGNQLYEFIINNYSWSSKLSEWHNLYKSLV